MPRKNIFTLVMIAILMITTAITSAQSGRTTITPDNADSLTQLIRLGRGSAERAVFASDGSTLAISGTVGVWLYDPANLATENEPLLLESEAAVKDVVITPDNTRVVAVLANGDVAVWDLVTQERIETVELSYSGGSYLAIHPDGGLIAVNIGSRGISLLDVSTWTETIMEGNMRGDSEVAFSPDGRWLVAVGADNAVYVWDVVNNEQASKLEGHTSTPISVSFSPDSTTLVTGSRDKTIRLWNTSNWTEKSVINQLDEADLRDVNRVQFSPDGASFASGHSDGNVIIWDVLTGEARLQFTIGGTGNVQELRYSTDGTQMITIDSSIQNVQMWDVNSRTLLATAVGHTPSMTALAFSPDSSELAFTGMSPSDLWLWDTASMQEINFAVRLEDQTTSSIINKIGIAYTTDGTLRAVLDSFSVKLLDTATNALVNEIDVDGIAEGLTFSPDNSLLAVISSRGLYIFDVSTGEQLAGFTDHNDWLTSVAFSPDQSLVATSARDRTVRVYGLE